MLSIQSFTEMNQAVPGSFVSPPMESPLECEVPSPSQWSDPCRSPPSLHSPPHYPELDKLKEEPISPYSFCATLTPSPPIYYNGNCSSPQSLMSKEGAEPSINLAEVVAENEALVHLVQHQQEATAATHLHHPQRERQQQLLLSTAPFAAAPSQPPTALQRQEDKDSFNQPFAFLDSLVDPKQEVVEAAEVHHHQQQQQQQQQTVPLASAPPPPLPPASSATCVARPPLLAGGTPTASTSGVPPPPSNSGGDFFKKTVEMALDHYTQDFQRVSSELSIPKDPSSWSVENVRAWLSFQANLLEDLPPLRLEHFNLSGKELMNLTEAQFRRLFPHGGDLFYAKLEIWKEALTKALPEHSVLFRPLVNIATSSSPQTSYQSTLLYQQQVLQRFPEHPHSFLQEQKPVAHLEKELKLPTTEYLQTYHPQSYPTSSQQIYKTAETLASLLAPSPRILTTTSLQSPQSPSSSTSSVSQSHLSLPVTSVQLPTVVVQAGSQQSTVHAQKQTTPVTIHSSQSQTVKKEKDSQVVLLEETSMDVTLQTDIPSTSTTSPQTSLDTQKDSVESEEEAEGDHGGAGSGTRTGTHIHLWQFLKELLQQPQHYGSCIRWLDRPKGVFKIEDSVRVARLWGKRKNRPAMNYDKLSRSIRQYYKKGIMKKTERSQRLVYQFCHPYSL